MAWTRDQHGRLGKHYVEVPDPFLADDGELTRLFDASLAHARTLKPKATTKKR